jgi:predicted DNA-binding transcriptional regulator AlpA
LDDAADALGVVRQRAQQIHAQIASRLREALIGNAAVAALLGREPAPEEVDDVDGLLLSTGQVEERTGLTREVIIDMIEHGRFPRAVAKDGRGHRLWREAMVERWRTQQQVPRPAVSEVPAQRTPMPSGPSAA